MSRFKWLRPNQPRSRFSPIGLGLREEDPVRTGKKRNGYWIEYERDNPPGVVTLKSWETRRKQKPYSWFTVAEAAEILGVSESAVYRYCKQGRLKSERWPSFRIIEPESLEDFSKLPRYIGRPSKPEPRG